MPRPNPFTPWSIASALLLVLLAATTWWNPLEDPDLWWLLWAGESIQAGTALPRLNTLSFTAPDTPWICHEPLVAWLYGALGISGIPLARMACHVLTVCLIARLIAPIRSGWASVLSLLWLLPLVSFSFTERALAWGNLCLCMLLVSLSFKGIRGSLIRIGLIALWANVHGSFVVGVFLLAMHRPKEVLLAVAASILNPHGLELHKLVLEYGLGSGPQGLVHHFVEEWRPLVPNTPSQAIRLAALAVGVWACVRTRSWRPVAIGAALIGLALLHWRYCTPAGLVLLPYVARAIGDHVPKRAPGVVAWPLVPALALTALAAPRVGTDTNAFPDPLLEVIPQNARIWSDFTLGGWLGRNGHKVFWDSRNDCYPKPVIEDGLRVAYQLDGWLNVLQEWNVDHVLTGELSVAGALRAEGWREVRTEGDLVLLARTPESG
ncbi:MAG: hypothetical protein VX519_12575 [Myxococcota bacterium]|nr:hypothetical protein [Myxococcota bacterium]